MKKNKSSRNWVINQHRDQYFKKAKTSGFRSRSAYKLLELDNKFKLVDNATIVVTHYQRLLDYIVPDYVHVLYKGRIVKSGTKELALELEEKGYDWIKEEIDSAATV